MRIAAGWVAVLLMASGCDRIPEAPQADKTAAPEGGYKAKIEALDERQRNVVFLRAVRDARQNCQGVIGSAYNGLHFGMPSWVARCSDGRDWLVMLDKGGRALVASRQEAGGAAPAR